MSLLNFKKNKSTEKELPIDYDVVRELQPMGGISFSDEKIIKTGDGYETCILVYEYPGVVNRHWLTKIMNISNAVTTIDVSTIDSNEILKNANKGMHEQSSRYASAGNSGDRMDSEARYQELDRIYREVAEMGEIIKPIISRIYLSGATPEELNNNVAGIMNYLESLGFKSAVNINESRNDWLALYNDYTTQQKNEYKREGQPITASCLAGGDPFHFTSLNDPFGFPYGATSSNSGGGKVLWDMFHFDDKRTSYNSIVWGRMGSGKSTMLKLMVLDRVVRGDKVMGFDPTGEYTDLVHKLGGKVVSLDGTQGMINALQIMKASDKGEKASYQIHISKLSTLYSFFDPQSDQYQRACFENLCHKLYIKEGITPPPSENWDKYNITGLPATAYPTFSDLLALATEELTKYEESDKSTDKDSAKYVHKIIIILENIINNYGSMFNGHTSVENFMDTQLVFFNIKELVSMKPEIFDAQLFQGLSLCWANAVTTGAEEKRKYEDGETTREDIKHFLMIIDESHRTINTSKPKALDQVLLYEREARKYFAGIVLASQSVRDYVPENSDGDKNVEKLKSLFELSQYKVMMAQDANTKNMLENIFDGVLTRTEIDNIPDLNRGECILSIAGVKNVQFDVEVSKAELDIFRGGV